MTFKTYISKSQSEKIATQLDLTGTQASDYLGRCIDFITDQVGKGDSPPWVTKLTSDRKEILIIGITRKRRDSLNFLAEINNLKPTHILLTALEFCTAGVNLVIQERKKAQSISDLRLKAKVVAKAEAGTKARLATQDFKDRTEEGAQNIDQINKEIAFERRMAKVEKIFPNWRGSGIKVGAK
jgi:chemotaxis response regulator CheB